MRASIVIAFCLFAPLSLAAETLGFFEQKFSAINFERGKWGRAPQGGGNCRNYVALENGGTVDVLRFGTSNLVPFKAVKGLHVVICGSTASFDEGFEAEIPPVDWGKSPAQGLGQSKTH